MRDATWTEVDGVPVVWCDAPGPLRAWLHVGIGIAHESVPTRGITHLVEHLALAGLHTREHPYNGTVGLTRTEFTADGAPGEVAEYLAIVCARLDDLPLDRLEAERRVLLAEALGNGLRPRDVLLGHRFGLQGYGLPWISETALRGLDGDLLAAWAAERFVRSRAALALSGPPPRGLRLPLPDGPGSPAVPDESFLTATPAWVRRGGPVAAGFVTDRTVRAGVASSLLHRTLRDRLRFDEGLTYDVIGEVDPLDAGRRHVTLSAAAELEHAARLGTRFGSIVEDLAERGPPPGTLDRLRAAAARDDATDSAVAHVHTAAIDRVDGRPYVTRAERDDTLAALTDDDVRDDLARIAGDALYLLPERVLPPREGCAEVRTDRPPVVVGGQTFRSSGAPWDADADFRLLVGRDGVSLVAGEQSHTVRWGDLVGVLRWEDGARSLMSRDGTEVVFVPADWLDGDEAARHIDRAVPPERIVVMRGGGPPPEPRSAPELAEPRASPGLLFGVLAVGVLFTWVLLTAAAPRAHRGETGLVTVSGRSWGLTVAGAALGAATAAGGVAVARNRRRGSP